MPDLQPGVYGGSYRHSSTAPRFLPCCVGARSPLSLRLLRTPLQASSPWQISAEAASTAWTGTPPASAITNKTASRISSALQSSSQKKGKRSPTHPIATQMAGWGPSCFQLGGSGCAASLVAPPRRWSSSPPHPPACPRPETDSKYGLVWALRSGWVGHPSRYTSPDKLVIQGGSNGGK